MAGEIAKEVLFPRWPNLADYPIDPRGNVAEQVRDACQDFLTRFGEKPTHGYIHTRSRGLPQAVLEEEFNIVVYRRSIWYVHPNHIQLCIDGKDEK